MKMPYTSPELEEFGNVVQLTGLSGTSGGGDFAWIISGDTITEDETFNSNDKDSNDWCSYDGGETYSTCPDDFEAPY